MKWSTAAAIAYNPDFGPLGSLTNGQADALLADAFGRWQGVVLSDIAFTPGPDLPYDVNATEIPFTNPAHWANFWRKPGDGRSPVIYDVDGSIIDDMFGEGARFDILGAAGLDNPITLSGTITEASIVINGAFLDNDQGPSSPVDLPSQLAFEAAMVHEIGHFVNLDHSVVNHDLAGDGDAANDVYLPSMYPFTVDDEEAMVTLNPDDEAALAVLYPAAGWAAATSGVAGVIRDGAVPFQGAGVVARRTDNPLLYAYSGISGASFFPCNVGGSCYPCSSGTICTTGDPDTQGEYEILGVAPGDYTICLDQIDTRLSLANGAFIGPLATPATIQGPEECYSTVESANPSTDDPDDVLPVLLPAGAAALGDILLNDLPVSDPFEPNDSLGTASLLADLPGGADTVGAVLGAGDLDYYLIPVTAGDTIRIDIDAAELGSSLDAVIGLYDDEDLLLALGVADDGLDPDSGSHTLDPELTRQLYFTGTAKLVVTSYPDADLNGVGGVTSGPYWLRVIRDGDSDGDGAANRLDGCPADPSNDLDADGFCGAVDNCPAIPSPSQADEDVDGVGDACDNCNGPVLVASFDFQSGAAGWTHQTFGGADTWHLASATCYGTPLSTTAFVSNGNRGAGCLIDSALERSKLLSPPIALPASGAFWLSFDALSFDEAGACLASSDIDSKDVGITTNGGASWTTLNSCTALADGSGTWNHRQFQLAGFNGQTVQIIFVYDTLDAIIGDTFAVDNVRIGPLTDTYNPGQGDADGDGIGDVCDTCTGDSLDDVDGDGRCGNLDNCPTLYNPAQNEGLRIKLNPPLPAGREVSSSSVSPNGARVVYRADQSTDNVIELYSVPVGGGAVTKLNPSLPAGRNVVNFSITPDSQRVVYAADQGTDEVFELYSVPIGGGAATKLNDALPPTGSVFVSWLISPNSARVIYRADRDVDNVFELFSVAATGGAVTKLNTPFVAGKSISGFFISPNSARVIYVANQDSSASELYSVPIGGGVVTKLNPLLVPSGAVFPAPSISPDSSRVVYMADQDVNNVSEIYSVPIAGGAVTRLNAPLPVGGEVFVPASISPDGTRVVYRADQDTDNVVELYSVPITGGASTKLNGALALGGGVSDFSISSNSARVIYRADQDTDTVVELYSVPMGGGAVTKLNDTLVAGGAVSSSLISPDSSQVVYLADQDTDTVNELYSVSIGGGAVTKLNESLASGGNVSGYLISPDSVSVVYLADQDTDTVNELYGVPLGGGAATKLHADLPIGRAVASFSIIPNGLRVVYRADQDTNDVNELYSTPLVDLDEDGIISSCDICPTDSDPGQEDGDMDGRGDACDNCRDVSNPGQQDTETAAGPDTFCDTLDDRAGLYGPDLTCGTTDDIVGDGVGDVCAVWANVTPSVLLGTFDQGRGASWGDYDGDGDPDLYVSNTLTSRRLYRNDGGGSFTDVTAGPLGYAGGVSSSWADYDADGDLDLYLATSGGSNRLLRNDGAGSFTDVTAGPLGMVGGSSASWVNYDGGYVDLLVSTASSNRLLRNVAGVFTDVTPPPLDTPLGATQVAAWGDYNNDFRPDVYLASTDSAGVNQLLRNEGGGVFTDVTTPALDPAGPTNGAAWGDFDNDGDLDLYLVRSAGTSRLLRNDGSGVFTDVTNGPLGGTSSYLGGTAWGDYDNDGNLDLAVASQCSRIQWMRNLGGGTFVDATSGAMEGPCGQSAQGLASADYDRDGDLDLFVVNDNGDNRLVRNESPPENHWLEVDLVPGFFTERGGIGARVRTVAGGVTRIREVAGQTGYLSQSSPTVHFGLGSSTMLDLLEIVWPSGSSLVLTEVDVDRKLSFANPGPPIQVPGATVVSILPEDGATDVALNTSIVLTVGNLRGPTADAISLSSNGIKVLGRVLVSADRTQVTFDPAGRLQPNSRYDVGVTNGLNGVEGGPSFPLSSFDTVGDASSGTLEAGAVGTQGAGAVIPGTNADDKTGFSVAAVGDVNGDGIADVAVGAPNADVSGNADAGKVILVLGGTQLQSNTGTPLRIEYLGDAASNQTGFAVSAAGDINNDGVEDLLIGAPGAAANSGTVYLVFGNAGLDEIAPVSMNLADLAACASPTLCGVVLTGAGGGEAGSAVSAAGDINDDEQDDLLIGAPLLGAGRVYLIYGPLTAPGTYALSSVGGTIAGVFFNGEADGDNAGTSVSSWPDVNGDMIDDLLIGAPGGDVQDEFGGLIANAGFVYAIHGGVANLVPGGTPAGTIELSRVANGLSDQVKGVVFLGEDPGGQIGRSVTGETDIDGDGVPDVIFGGSQEAWVIPGDDPKTQTGTSQTQQTPTLSPGGLRNANGQDVQTQYKAWFFSAGLDGNLGGVSVGTAGDVNDDGVDDLIIGAGGVNLPGKVNAGKAYIHFGSHYRPKGEVPLSDIGHVSPGVAVNGFEAGDDLGRSVGGGLDVNGDGIDDALVGAPLADALAGTQSNAGEAYVISPLTPGEVPLLLVTHTGGITTLEWDVADRAFLHSVYRGTVTSVIAMGGVFTSATTKLACGISTDVDMDGMPDTTDATSPPVDGIFYYLVTGRNLLGEGPLGPPGLVPPRINDSQCP